MIPRYGYPPPEPPPPRIAPHVRMANEAIKLMERLGTHDHATAKAVLNAAIDLLDAARHSITNPTKETP